MTQNERDTRLARMEELIKEIVKLKRTILDHKFSIAERLTVQEYEEVQKQYQNFLKEYSQLLTTEVLEHLPGKISESLKQIPGLVTKITYYPFPTRPAQTTISEFIEDLIKENIENQILIEIVLRKVSQNGLIIEIPGGNLAQAKEGESK